MENQENKGVRAEERNFSEKGSYFGFESYLSGFSSYIPSSIKKQFPSRSSGTATPNEEKDKIESVTFSALETENQTKIPCLIITYSNGFQIWNIENPENVYEIFSKREGPIKLAKLLPLPLIEEDKEHPFYGKRPLIAIASKTNENPNFPNNMVKLISLKNGECINILRFRTEVKSITCSKTYFVVGLMDHLYIFDAVSMKKKLTLQTYPSHSSAGIVALGPRWIAYPGNEPIAASSRPSGSDKFVEVAKDFASGIYQFGRKTFSEYMYPENKSTTKSPEEKDSEYAGTVIVQDIASEKYIAHFKAHVQPISVLVFDPSGTMLVTASVEGHNFNVFQIRPKPDSHMATNYAHIYKLQRGLTNATIQNITFSKDSRWMAVNSSRGTTHIYAINPCGGPVTIHTHLRSSTNQKNKDHIYSNEPKKLETLPSCARIKQSAFEDLMPTKNQPYYVISSSAFVGNSLGTELIDVFTHNGILTRYQLRPHKPHPGSDISPETLLLDVEPVIEWDVCRRIKWPEVQLSLLQLKTDEEKKDKSDNEPKWLSKVEICTHSPYIPPLWTTPKFTFKTFNVGSEHQKEKGKYSFFEKTPTKKIEIRQPDFIPFKEGEHYQLYSDSPPSFESPPPTNPSWHSKTKDFLEDQNIFDAQFQFSGPEPLKPLTIQEDYFQEQRHDDLKKNKSENQSTKEIENEKEKERQKEKERKKEKERQKKQKEEQQQEQQKQEKKEEEKEEESDSGEQFDSPPFDLYPAEVNDMKEEEEQAQQQEEQAPLEQSLYISSPKTKHD